MKFFVAILVFMMTVQPLQAGVCDMESTDASGAHATMQHGDMQHGDMQQGAESGGASHHCCQPTEADGETPCANLHCSGCFVGVAAIPALTAIAGIPPVRSLPVFGDGQLAASHSVPPFRPPISFS